MVATSDVLFSEVPGQGGNLGIITLNRPEVLNSLNAVMIHSLHAQLKAWATNRDIKAVVIQAAPGRAFCAGGDLRLTYERYQAHDSRLTQFFHDEYQLNRFIFHYPKPYIALLDGITMGGGVGISVHGSHRIATDRLLFAMPETGIGFFPDVGGSYFLPRLPGYLGFYLGLTGARIHGDDCVTLGIAQHKLPVDKLPALITALAEHPFDDHAHASVSNIIAELQISPLSSSLMAQQEAIDACFSQTSVEKIVQALQSSRLQICQEAALTLAKKSPTSLKVTLLALQRGSSMDFDNCMRQDYRLACHFAQGHDFMEGIRAVIIDKDQSPHWKPSLLADVTSQQVEQYFAPLSEELS